MSRKVAYPILILILAITGYYYYNPNRQSVKESIEEVDSYEEPNKNIPKETELKISGAENAVPENLKPNAAPPRAPLVVAGPATEKTQRYFAESVKMLGQCLDIKTAVDGDQVDPVYDNLENSVRNELGETVIRSEDWSNTHIKLSNGEERRIRIETDLSGDSTVVKRLRYYSVDKEGLPVLIPLPKEQTEDPSETLIASMLKEGTPTLEESGKRAYFQNGEEMIYVERNGKLSEYEMSKGTRTFKCMSLDSDKSSCKCF